MPHLIVEYSANIESALDLPVLMRSLKERAVATGVFPLGGIRVRGACRQHYDIADGNADNAFVHLQARIGAGRDAATRSAAADALFAVLTEHLEALYAQRGLGISLEFVEIDPVTSRKRNNLHERLQA